MWENKETSLGDLFTFVKGFLVPLRTQVKVEGLERRYWQCQHRSQSQSTHLAVLFQNYSWRRP